MIVAVVVTPIASVENSPGVVAGSGGESEEIGAGGVSTAAALTSANSPRPNCWRFLIALAVWE
jgi:hypothetical protein